MDLIIIDDLSDVINLDNQVEAIQPPLFQCQCDIEIEEIGSLVKDLVFNSPVELKLFPVTQIIGIGGDSESGTDMSNFLQKGNFLSEFATDEDKAKARKNLGISGTGGSTSGSDWGSITGSIILQDDLMKEFDKRDESTMTQVNERFDSLSSSDIAYENEDYSEIKTLGDAMDILLYKPLTISSFKVTPTLKEYGEYVSELNYTWSYSKPLIKNQYLNNQEIEDLSVRTMTVQGPFNNTITGTIRASDGKTTVSASVSTIFKKATYYGVWGNTPPTNLDVKDNFNMILNLASSNTVGVNAVNGNYIYVLIPAGVSLDNPSFYIGTSPLPGGMNKVTDSFIFNKYGVNVLCSLYKSTNPDLGSTTIRIL